MDLFKTLDCIPHDLLIVKMHAYGFSGESLTFFHSYLERGKQSATVNNTQSVFQVFLSDVPQGSILGQILFNTFISNLFYKVKEVELHIFADDNTVSPVDFDVAKLLKTLETESQMLLVGLKKIT